MNTYHDPEDKVINLLPRTNAVGWLCVRVFHSSTRNIVPECVISHVPSKYNLYNNFITCILNYGWPEAQDIKRGSD